MKRSDYQEYLEFKVATAPPGSSIAVLFTASLSNNPRIFNDTMILSNDASLCALKLTCRSSFLCQEGIELMTI